MWCKCCRPEDGLARIPVCFVSEERNLLVIKRLSLILLLILLEIPAVVFSQTVLDLTTQTYQVITDSTTIQLPHPFILPQSDSVWVDYRPQQRGRDYQIDYNLGRVTLLFASLDSVTVQVRYRRFPFSLPPVSYLHLPVRVADIQDTVDFSDIFASPPVPARPYRSALADAPLQVGGSKTIGLQLGSNRDMTLEQSLRVNVFGEITDGITVRALLSDQNTPLQPEGTTENLSELDKVLIEIEGTHFLATLGDYDLRFHETEFATVSRTLQGVKGDLHVTDHALTVAAAVSDGQFRTQEFRGSAGKQGPYPLYGEHGERGIVVLGGSESVWLDGELLKRGESHDYIIDYSTGEITFMPRRLITGESRLIVDFEYTTRQYPKSLYAATTTNRFWDGKLQLNMTFLHEGDDKNHPVETDFTDAQQRILEQAGDHPDSAWAEGWEFAGTNEGDYIREGDQFVWAGRDSGDYDVRFTRVADGTGTYIYAGGDRGFAYVGEGLGNYIPYLILPLPERHQLGDVRLQLRPLDYVTVQSEIALSNRDRNTFSPKDDHDNTGVATFQSIRFQPVSDRWGTLDVRGSFHSVSSQFYALGRTNEVEFNRNWGAEITQQSQESRLELNASYQPHPLWRFRGFYGSMERGSNFSSRREEGRLQFSPKRFPALMVAYRRVKTAQDSLRFWRTYQQIRTGLERWQLQPSFSVVREQNRLTWGDQLRSDSLYTTIGGELAWVEGRYLTASGSITYRTDERYDAGQSQWQETATSSLHHYKLNLQNWHRFNATMEYQHYRKDGMADSGTNQRADAGELQVQYQAWRRALRTNLLYSVLSSETQLRQEVYTDVGEHQGNYSYDPLTSDYYPDPDGRYVREVILSQNSTPTTELKMSLLVEANPASYFRHLSSDSLSEGKLSRMLRHLKAITEFRIEQQTHRSDLAGLILDPRFFEPDDHTIRGIFFFRQQMDILPNPSEWRLQLRYEMTDRAFNDTENNPRTQEEWRVMMRALSDYWQPFALEGRWEHEYDQEVSALRGVTREVRANEWVGAATYTPADRWEIALRNEWQQSRAKSLVVTGLAAYTVRRISVIPTLTVEFTRSHQRAGRILVELNVTQLSANKDDVPLSILRQHRLGTNWGWRWDGRYNFNAYITGVLNYSGRVRPGEAVYHLGQMEIQAFF